jgi:uncharacterized OsmC-like protein
MDVMDWRSMQSVGMFYGINEADRYECYAFSRRAGMWLSVGDRKKLHREGVCAVVGVRKKGLLYMNGDFNIELSLIDDKVKFECVSETHPELPMVLDYIPPLGAGQGLAGLEALACSFAGCVSTAVVALLRRAGAQIGGFKAHVTAFRKEQPLMLEKIIYTAEVTSDNTTDEMLKAALERAGAVSPVWLCLHPSIAVETGYVLNKA